jgi:PKD domain
LIPELRCAGELAEIVQYRWDFGDKSPIVTTDDPTVTHPYTPARPTTPGWRSPTASAT